MQTIMRKITPQKPAIVINTNKFGSMRVSSLVSELSVVLCGMLCSSTFKSFTNHNVLIVVSNPNHMTDVGLVVVVVVVVVGMMVDVAVIVDATVVAVELGLGVVSLVDATDKTVRLSVDSAAVSSVVVPIVVDVVVVHTLHNVGQLKRTMSL